MKNKLGNPTNHSYAELEKFFLKELNKHAPLKKKILRQKTNAFMKKYCGRKLCCNEIISIGAIISVIAIVAQVFYVKLRNWMSNKSQTINSSGKVSNHFLMTKDLILQN